MKYKIMILVFLMFSIFFANSADAKDLVWIDAPDSIESQMPFELTVHIEDPNVIKYANKMYVRPRGGGIQFVEKGEEEFMKPEFNYTGQKEFTFIVYGNYDDYYFDNTINFTVSFISDYETLTKDFDPIDLDYWYGVGDVSKLIEILPIKGTGSFPSYPNCERSERFQLEGVTYYNCQYNSKEAEDKHPRVWSAGRSIIRHACVDTKYQEENNLFGCNYLSKSKIGTTETNGNDVIEITSHTWSVPSLGEGSREGYLRLTTGFSESRKYIPKDKEDPVLYNLIYIVDFYQKAGILDYSGSVQKSMWIEKDEVESEKQQIISDAEEFVGSIAFSKQGNVDANKDYKSKYTSYLPGKLQDTKLYVYGYVKNRNDKPLPYMHVEVYIDEKKAYEGYTDLNGNYEIELKDLRMKEDDEINATLYFNLDYVKDDKNYFKLYKYKSDGDTYNGAYIWKDIKITPDSNVEFNLALNGGLNNGVGSNVGLSIAMRDYATIYVRMHEAVEFATERLHLDLDYKLPVEVLVGKNDKETLYSPDQSLIKIARSDMSHTSSNNPRNREYHEFAHAIMYDLYGDWPKDRTMPNTKNHDGYLNPSTADSYMEGFAEFMALAMAKYQGEKDADIYAAFGSLEDNYKPWSAKGFYEELAVSSLLWDMYDSNNEEGDTLTMSLDDIWRVITIKHDNFYQYYEAFIARFPEKEKEFNELFKLHGFFYDTRVGNKQYDTFEPLKDANDNNIYDNGEFFVDLSFPPKNITYEEGFKIGQATNYERKTRTQAVMLKDAFLKVDPTGPRFYKITVDYEDPARETYSYFVEMKQGLIYVQPRPDDVEAKITIVPETQDFSFKKTFEIKNSVLIEDIYTNPGNGYFSEHDFVLTKLSEDKDPVYLEDGFEPSYTTDEAMDGKINENIDGSEKTKEKSNFGWLVWVFILSLGGVYIYMLVTNKKTRTATKVVIKKTEKGVAIFSKSMKEKHIPNMKKTAKNMHTSFNKNLLPKIKSGMKATGNALVKTGKWIGTAVKKTHKKITEKSKK